MKLVGVPVSAWKKHFWFFLHFHITVISTFYFYNHNIFHLPLIVLFPVPLITLYFSVTKSLSSLCCLHFSKRKLKRLNRGLKSRKMKIHFMCISRNVRDSELLKLNDVNLEYCKEVKILSVTLETRILGVTLKYLLERKSKVGYFANDITT